MTDEQRTALADLAKAVRRFERAYAEMLVASQGMELAMGRCREVNDVAQFAAA